LSIYTNSILVDIGADAYLIINKAFISKLKKYLELELYDDFKLGYVTLYKKA
ncbi:hypothetical protein GE21DRAFT_1223527, partial [Neurospora crassa]